MLRELALKALPCERQEEARPARDREPLLEAHDARVALPGEHVALGGAPFVVLRPSDT